MKTREQKNEASRQTYRMPSVLDVVQTGREAEVKEKLPLPLHCYHRMITGSELVEGVCSVQVVEKLSYIGRMVPDGYQWFLIKCEKPGNQRNSMSSVNLVRMDGDGGLRLVLAGTTITRITNYLENQPKWAVCPIPSVSY